MGRGRGSGRGCGGGGGWGRGVRGARDISIHLPYILHYHMVLRPKGTSHKNVHRFMNADETFLNFPEQNDDVGIARPQVLEYLYLGQTNSCIQLVLVFLS